MSAISTFVSAIPGMNLDAIGNLVHEEIERLKYHNNQKWSTKTQPPTKTFQPIQLN